MRLPPLILDRYIAGRVLGAAAGIGFVLSALQAFVGVAGDAGSVGKGGFGVAALLQVTLWRLPAGLYLLMPLVALLAALWGLGTLATSSELTAMRAGGLTRARLGGVVLAAGLGLGGVSLLLGETVAPAGELAVEELRAGPATGPRAAVARDLWLVDADSFINIGELLGPTAADGVALWVRDGRGGLKQTLSAARARYQAGRGWRLEDVRQTGFEPDLSATHAGAAASLPWATSITPNLLQLYVLQADAISLSGLSRLIAYLDRNHLDASTYRLQWWRRAVEPFTVAAMALLAVPFALGSLRNTGMGQRLLVGIGLGLLLFVVLRTAFGLGQIYRWPAPLVALVPTLGLYLTGAWRLARAR